MVSALHALTPTYEHERVSKWQHTPCERERGRPVIAGLALRCFDVVWYPRERPRSFHWYGNGEAAQCLVSIFASYRNVPPSLLDHMLWEDGIDLMREFTRLGEPTTPGLSHFEELGIGASEVDDLANAWVEHRFRVHWAQDTD